MYVTQYQVTVLVHMHEPHSSRVCRITHFVHVEVIMAPYKIKIKNLFSAKDAVLFINLHAQAVAPVMSVRQTDILLHVFVNI